MANQAHRGLRRLIRAFVYSWAGLKATWRHEEAFRLEIVICLILAPIALWLGESGVERALLIGSLLLIIMAELVNSSVEAIVDRIGPERHELSGRAKDIASAVVFVALLNATLVWFFIFVL